MDRGAPRLPPPITLDKTNGFLIDVSIENEHHFLILSNGITRILHNWISTEYRKRMDYLLKVQPP